MEETANAYRVFLLYIHCPHDLRANLVFQSSVSLFFSLPPSGVLDDPNVKIGAYAKFRAEFGVKLYRAMRIQDYDTVRYRNKNRRQ